MDIINDELDHVFQDFNPSLTWEIFTNTRQLQRSSMASMILIGNAFKDIEPFFRKEYNTAYWRQNIRLRDKVAHFTSRT
ncbi:MAG: hypothetical protein OXC92_02470 [Flavobacteriaceae bacterium]|nr:hypothetical protein [Flavobacteriaceae bacterium]MCY4253971.1 hypothetical protein [Flavobacteriaceae bacterium]